MPCFGRSAERKDQEGQIKELDVAGFLRGAAVVVLVGIASSSMADDLRVVGGDVVWADAEQPLNYIFGVENVTVPPELPETMAGWALSLALQPDVEALGTVEFRSIAIPPDYVFEGVLTFGLRSEFGYAPEFSQGTSVNLVGDVAPGGVTVPATGRNLLQLELVASPDAQGRFDILATPNDSQASFLSYWTSISSSTSPTISDRYYLNVPSDGGPVVVGSVRIGEVPEPATWVMLLCGAGILGIGIRRLRGRRYLR